MSEYLHKKKIYENGTSTVFAASKNGKQLVVMKYTEKDDGLKEKQLLEQLNPHRLIIPLLDYFEVDEKTVCLVFPYIENQWDAVQGDIELIRLLTVHLLKGLEYMHSQGVVHCDLKPDNILFDGHDIRIIDFGNAQRIKDLGQAELGTGSYSPLELHDCRRPLFTPQIDTWSVGVILVELLTGVRLFSGEDDDERVAKIEAFVDKLEEDGVYRLPKALAVSLTPNESFNVSLLLTGMLQGPEIRWSAATCLQSSWITHDCQDAVASFAASNYATEVRDAQDAKHIQPNTKSIITSNSHEKSRIAEDCTNETEMEPPSPLSDAHSSSSSSGDSRPPSSPTTPQHVLNHL